MNVLGARVKRYWLANATWDALDMTHCSRDGTYIKAMSNLVLEYRRVPSRLQLCKPLALKARGSYSRRRQLAYRRAAMACSDCAKPAVFWEGTPSGKIVKLGGIESYIAEPKSKTGKAVVLFPDAGGWEPKNTRLLADKFAASGITAVLSEWFQGDEFPIDSMLKGDFGPVMEWKGRHEPDVIIPMFDKVAAALSSDYGIKSIGAIGYCWGGRMALKVGATDKAKAVVMNHGSFTNREEIEALKQPTLINASDNDQLLSRERLAQYTGVLDCKKDIPSNIKLFEGMEHGWTLRGDAKDPKVGPNITEAFDRADKWFQKYL